MLAVFGSKELNQYGVIVIERGQQQYDVDKVTITIAIQSIRRAV